MATTSARERQEAARIAAFFRERVLPLAARLRSGGRPLFPVAPDPSAATYFTPVPRRRMAPADFLGPSGLAAGTLEEKLRTLWRERGADELAELGPGLARLAAELEQLVEDEGEEISPFVYVMY
jgi:hypothetical protein